MIAELALNADIDPRPGRLRAFFTELLTTLLTLRERMRQRRALADCDDRLLADIGISRADAAREIRKPFWHA